MIGNEIDEIIENLFDSLLQKCKKCLEKWMKGSDFVFDSVDLLNYKLHEISLNWSGSYVDSQKELKNKKATINPKYTVDKCFQYALTVALNHKEYQILSLLLINIIGKKWVFHHIKRIEKSLNQIINQLLLMYIICTLQ